jgi:hypothetical protein
MPGEFSRARNQAALNVALSIGGPSGSNLGDIVATITTAISAGTAATTSLVCSGGTSRSIPSGAVIICSSTTGTNIEAYLVNGAMASGVTTITVTSQTANRARANGDLVWVLQVPQPYLALITSVTPPTDNGLGSEYAATGYARQPVTWSAPTAADPPVTANTTLLTWGPMSAGTGAVLHNLSLMDALSGGTAANQLAWWTLAADKTPGSGDSVTTAANTGVTMSCL